MLFLAIFGCLFISLYLLFYSSYRINNYNGFILLFATFTIHSIFILTLPLCQIYLLYFVLFINIDSFDCFYHPIIVFYCVIESFFFLYTIELARLLNNRPLPKRISLPKNYSEQFIDRILNVYEKCEDDFRICFSGWFNGINNSSFSLIYEENILEYISMATYGIKYPDEITEKKEKYIKKLYKKFLRKYPEQKSKIKSGYNNRIQLKHPYKDLIRYTHYPLMKYLLFASVRSLTTLILKSMGFQYQIIDNVTFYIRLYTKQTK